MRAQAVRCPRVNGTMRRCWGSEPTHTWLEPVRLSELIEEGFCIAPFAAAFASHESGVEGDDGALHAVILHVFQL